MRATLLLRALLGAWFALRMAAAASWFETADLLAMYLRVDGTVAIALAAMLGREALQWRAGREGALAFVLLVDGAGRLVSGLAARIWPGLLEFPVTIMVFLGIMALCTAAVGLVEGTLVVEEEAARHGRKRQRPQFAAGPVGMASLLSVGFGVAAILGAGNLELMQKLMVAHVASMGGVMAAAAWSRRSGGTLPAAQ